MESKKITLLELEVLEAAERFRSVRSLARYTNLKPAHVSKILARLEAKLGRSLFHRSSQGLVLSRESHNVLKAAKEILKSAALLEMNAESDVEPTLLTIGSLSYINKEILSGVLPALEDSRYRFRLVDSAPDNLVISAVRGVFDILVHTENKSWTKTWSSTEVGKIRWGLFSRKGHPLGTKAEPEEAIQYPFLFPTYFVDSHFATGSDHCPISMSQRKKGFETSTADTAARVVERSDQLSFLPKIVGESNGKLQEVKVKGWDVVDRSVYLLVNVDTVTEKLRNELVKALREALS